jgi:hypothetical protein
MGRPRKAAEQTTSTIYRGADGSWHARVTMGRRPVGRTQRKHVQRRTKADLRDAVREVERQRDAQGFTWTQGDLTLGAWLEHWLDAVLPMTVRWKTLSTYRSQLRCHVMPAVGPAEHPSQAGATAEISSVAGRPHRSGTCPP